MCISISLYQLMLEFMYQIYSFRDLFTLMEIITDKNAKKKTKSL